MATTVQPQAGQPVYLPPGTAPPAMVAMQPNPAAPGTVMYYPPGTAGVPQGAVLMVSVDLTTHRLGTGIRRHTYTSATHTLALYCPQALLWAGSERERG